MRPVNLIPKEQQRSRSGITAGRTGLAPYLVLGALGLAVVGVAAVVLTSNSVNEKKDEIAQLEGDTAAAKASADVLRPYGNFAQVEQARVDTVNSLIDTSFNWERVLRSLSRTIPSNAWLTGFVGTVSPEVKVDAGGGGGAATARGKTKAPAVGLVGCTYSHSAVARMMVRMRNIDDVSQVVLQSSEKSDAAEQTASSDAGNQGDSGGGDDCRTDRDITKFEILVILGYNSSQLATASTVAGPGAAPVAAAQGAAETASTPSAGAAP